MSGILVMEVGSNSKAGTNYGAANAAASAGTRANQVFNLSARIVAEQRPPEPVRSNQIDPALLARIALEEELKRRGGGGGGGVKSFNPMNFIPYSFKLMSEAIESARQAFNQALSQAFAMPAPVNNVLAQVQNFITNVLNQPVAQNLNTAINQTFSQLAQAMQNPGQLASRLASNVMQLANSLASAVAAGLKKVFNNKEEDRLDLKRVWGVFANVGNDANQSNARNIKSHIDNLAKQVTRFFANLRFGA
jgi:hypothetical protein